MSEPHAKIAISIPAHLLERSKAAYRAGIEAARDVATDGDADAEGSE